MKKMLIALGLTFASCNPTFAQSVEDTTYFLMEGKFPSSHSQGIAYEEKSNNDTVRRTEVRTDGKCKIEYHRTATKLDTIFRSDVFFDFSKFSTVKYDRGNYAAPGFVFLTVSLVGAPQFACVKRSFIAKPVKSFTYDEDVCRGFQTLEILTTPAEYETLLSRYKKALSYFQTKFCAGSAF